MKLNKFSLLLAAFIVFAACEENNPITPDNNDKDDVENVTPNPEPEPEPAELKLTFDFTNTDAMAGWPQALAASEVSSDQFICPYKIGDVTYNFISSQPLEVAANSLQWPYFSATENLIVIPKQRYLGLPIVPKYKLTKVFFVAQAIAAKYVIASEVGVGTAEPTLVPGGGEQSDAAATEFTFNLTDTQVGAQYWLKVANKSARMTSMTLTYTK